MRVLWIFFLAVAIGCASKSRSPVTNERAPLDEAKVLAIARQAVAGNAAWVRGAKFEKPHLQPDGSWAVLVWEVPAKPGGHFVIYIDKQGRITKYVHGR
jgi:hypothetical protein